MDSKFNIPKGSSLRIILSHVLFSGGIISKLNFGLLRSRWQVGNGFKIILAHLLLRSVVMMDPKEP